MGRSALPALIQIREIASRITRWLRSGREREIARAALEIAPVGPADVALVIGLDRDRLVAALTARCSLGFVAGVDPLQRHVRQASRRNRVALREGRIELLQADSLSLPYPDGMFDAVYSLDATRDVVGSPGALREIARVTRAGGTLLLGFPQAPPIPDRIETMRSRLRQAGYEHFKVISAATADGHVDFLRARLETTDRENDAQGV